MKRSVLVSTIIGIILLVGCGLKPTPTLTVTPMPTATATPTSTPTDTPTPTPTSTPTNTPTPTPKVVTVTINATGDVTLGSNQKQGYEGSFHQYYDKKGKDYFLQHVRDIFEADDCTVVNLEGTLTDSEEPYPGKVWVHKGQFEYIDILKDSSVEVVTLGNNHIMDYLKKGVSDTVKTVKDAGIVYALNSGWGNDVGVFETKDGIKIGFVSVNVYNEKDRCYKYLEEGYNLLREQGCELVLACPHWGGDKDETILESQSKMGKWCIDFGYDLVIGCHAHLLQGIEIYKDKYIVYGMGNFCYGGSSNPPKKDSMIWHQTFTFVDGVLQSWTDGYVIPCSLSSVTYKNDYSPVVLKDKDADGLFERLSALCKAVGTYVDNEGRVHLAE